MAGKAKRWVIAAPDEEQVSRIMEHAGLPEPLARVVALRAFADIAELDDFLDPRLARFSDPFHLPDMQQAVDRIRLAIGRQERITVFGDYDVDGVTSTALMTRVLIALGGDVMPFIPDRMDEGYGLSEDAVARCIDEHRCGLIVSVDCGVNSVASVSAAQASGVDVIITDHHEPDEQTAPAFALVNPKLGERPDLEILSGAGVAFKLAHALVKSAKEDGDARADALDLREYIDIAALGAVADLVPLTGENRIIVRHGLAQMGRTKWAGLKALMHVAGVKGEPDTYQLGYQLGPRINAAGRIGQPMQALSLLITDDRKLARDIAEQLDRDNRDRRAIEQEMSDEAFQEIDTYFDPAEHFGLVVAREGWHPGVVGIVASRVSRHYNRPAIVMSIEEAGTARGSCRSIDEYNLLDGLQACEALLNRFGGHKMAAGLEVREGHLDRFKQDFNAAAASELSAMDLTPVQHIDAVVSADDIGDAFMENLKRLQPFGQENREPVWALTEARLAGHPRIVGEKHLKFNLQKDGRRFPAIAFNFAPEDLPDGAFDVAFTLKENTWMGNTSLQLQVEGVRKSD
jgi:single-stranded-DNA-specific exonuclease